MLRHPTPHQDWDGAVVAFSWTSEATPPPPAAGEKPVLSFGDVEEAAKAAGLAGEPELLAARAAAAKEYAEAKAKGREHLSGFLESKVKGLLADGTGNANINLMAMATGGAEGDKKEGEKTETDEEIRERQQRLLRKLLTLPIPACMSDAVRGCVLLSLYPSIHPSTIARSLPPHPPTPPTPQTTTTHNSTHPPPPTASSSALACAW